jgi:RNA polymerase sigma-70 factor, ECF subfamily
MPRGPAAARLDTARASGYSDAVAPDYSPDETMASAVQDDRENALVQAARRGDAEAFREIYRTYREPVWSVVLSLVGDPLQAQDILQNVFFKAFRGLPRFRFRSGLFTWLYRIARNECRNHLRKRRLPVVPLEDILGSRYEADTARAADGGAWTRADTVKGAVMQLPFRMREVIVLKYQEDLSYDEMSRVLGCPPGTVASRLNRALAELETLMRPSEGAR